MTAWPGWKRLMVDAGLSRSTVAGWLRWLRKRGLIAIVKHGSTPEFRPGVPYSPDDGNLAALYLLCQPSPPADEPDADGPESEDRPVAIFGGDETRTPPARPRPAAGGGMTHSARSQPAVVTRPRSAATTRPTRPSARRAR